VISVSHESVSPRPWSDCPWLDLRAAELCATTAFASAAIYRAARTLWQSGIPDEKAANILITVDSEQGQIMGPEAYVDQVLTVLDADWPRRTEL
jgi:hypothetical protein